MNQRVLIVSDVTEFSRSIVSRWQSERTVPAVTIISSALCDGASASTHDVAIVGGLRRELLEVTLKKLDSTNRTVIAVANEAALVKRVREAFPRVLVLREYLGWVDALVLLTSEALRRVDAAERARRAEEKVSGNERFAALGQYVLEMRHSMNNALTSVLGNAELLLMEPGAFGAEAREQIETIHTMALRMHEIVQRLSSLDTELTIAEKESQSEMRRLARGIGF